MRFTKFAAALLSITSLVCALQDSSNNTEIDINIVELDTPTKDVNPVLRASIGWYQRSIHDVHIQEGQSKYIDAASNAVTYGVDGCVSIHFFTTTRCIAAAHVELDLATWKDVTNLGCDRAKEGATSIGHRVTKVIIMAPTRSAAMVTHNYIRSKFPRAHISPRIYNPGPNDGTFFNFVAYRGTTDVVPLLDQ